MMKKCLFVIFILMAMLCISAMASEIPDPDYYFNAQGTVSYDDGQTYIDYSFAQDNTFTAVEQYVNLLIGEHGFTMTDSYVDEDGAQWRLENADGSRVRVYYDIGGSGYNVSICIDEGISLNAAKAWDWENNCVSGMDINVLPDFLANDSSQLFYLRSAPTPGDELTYDFRADSHSDACAEAAENYLNLLLARGYTIVEFKENDSDDWDMLKWYLHSGQEGMGRIESGIDAHIMMRINIYHDNGYSAFSVNCVDGITMMGYEVSPAPDGDDFFDKDCWWCSYDGRCDDCGGTGSVWKLVQGTSDYILQNCEDCNFGECRYCGGDGRQ